MRVAYVCTDPGIGVFGTKGASLHVRAVVAELARRGHEVHLVATRIDGAPPAAWAEPAVTIHRLPPVTGRDRRQREDSARRCDAALGAVLDGLARTAPLDLVYERYALWGRSGTAWASAHDVPSVLEVNAPLVTEQAVHRGLSDRAGAEDVARAAIRAAGTVVCVSDAVRTWAAAFADDPTRVHTVANGVDTTRIRPATTPVTPAGAERFTVGFVGTLKPWHGTEVLLDAMALLVRHDPTYRLLLVGDGPEATALADRARAHGISAHVETPGAVAADDVGPLLARMDIACAPYPATGDQPFYFSPLKVYEYLAAGLPVVASRVGDLPLLLDDGRLGALLAPGDPAALAAGIADLRADDVRRTALRAATRRAALGHDWSHVVTRILALAGRDRAAGTHSGHHSGQQGGSDALV